VSPIIHMQRTEIADAGLAVRRSRPGTRSSCRTSLAIATRSRSATRTHSSSTLRLRRASLCRQSSGGDAVDNPVRGDLEALPGDRIGGGTKAYLLQLYPLYLGDESSYSRVIEGPGHMAFLHAWGHGFTERVRKLPVHLLETRGPRGRASCGCTTSLAMASSFTKVMLAYQGDARADYGGYNVVHRMEAGNVRITGGCARSGGLAGFDPCKRFGASQGSRGIGHPRTQYQRYY
jgi:hypothetical protein